jgi:hypothetical protein
MDDATDDTDAADDADATDDTDAADDADDMDTTDDADNEGGIPSEPNADASMPGPDPTGGLPDSGPPPTSEPEGGGPVDGAGPDGDTNDGAPTPDEPDSGSLPRGLPIDELPEALLRYWLVDAQIMGCGDRYRYESFGPSDQFTRSIVYSDPGCVGGDPPGNTEYPGTYQLAGRRLTVVQAEPAVESQYDIAIEEDQVGLTQYVGIYLRQSQSDWVRQASRERRDESGALQWRVSSSVAAEFAAPLPLDGADPCSLTLHVEIEVEGVDPEGVFPLEFGPYACTVDEVAPGQIIRIPVVTTEELSGLDSVVQQEVQGAWPLFLRLPRLSAEYLLPTGGYAEIAESDVRR